MRKKSVIFFRILATVFLILPAFIALPAQEQMTITLSDDTIEFNETVTVSLSASVKDFNHYAELPSSEGFYVTDNLNGMSYNQSNQFINIEQTFTLQPLKAGTYYVGRAWIQSGSKRIFSNQLTLTIKAANEPQAVKNFFIVSQPSKTKALVGEPIEVKVWAWCPEGNSFSPSSEGPASTGYSGFWHYDGEYTDVVPYDKKTITIKGKKYIGFPIYSEYIFPNSTGRIALPVYEYYCTVSTRPFPSSDYYDDDYLDGTETEVEKKTDSVFIYIEPIPTDGRPANFLGDVGNFTLEATVDKTDLKAYESIKLTVTLSGAGNINGTHLPDPAFPAGFEHFAPATEEQTIQTDIGIVGSKTFTYTVIPTKEGNFTLNGISFSYYDISKKEYVSLKAKDIQIHVAPGKPNLPDTSVNNLPDGFLSPQSPVKKVLLAFVVVVLPLAILVALLVWWLRKRKRRKEEEIQNETIAEKPAPPPGQEFRIMLRNAEMLFSQRNVQASLHLLYETMHSACSKKCELDRSEASVSQIRYRLSTKKIEQADIDQIAAFLERCSLIRYSWASQNPETIRKILSDASLYLTKLGY